MKKFLIFLLAFITFGVGAFFVYDGLLRKELIEVNGLVLEYELGDEINLNNTVIRYFRDSNFYRFREVNVTQSMVTGFNTQTVGTKTLVITYGKATKTIEYVVKNTAYFTVHNLTTNYELDDTLDLTDAYIKYYASETATEFTQVNLTTEMITGFNTETVGTRVMTINYGRASETLDYTVGVKTYPITQAQAIYENAINNAKNQEIIKGLNGNTLALVTQNSSYINANYFEIFDKLTEDNLTTYKYSTNSNQNTKTIDLTNGTTNLIEKNLMSLYISPNSVEDYLTITGGEDRSITITLTAMVNEQEQNITIVINNNLITEISYNDSISTFKYNAEAGEIPSVPTNVDWIVDDYTQPRIEAFIPTTIYELDDTLNLTGAYIKYYENRRTEEFTNIDVTPEMVDGFNTDFVETKFMTITYQGVTTEVEYTVGVKTYALSEAATIYTNARNNVLNQTKIEGFVQFNNYHIILTQQIVYSGSEDLQSWMVLSGENKTTYTWYVEEPLNSTNNTKVTSTAEFTNAIEAMIDNIFLSIDRITSFVSITGHEDRSITIVLTSPMESQPTNCTITIKNGLITQLLLNETNEAINYYYNNDASEIPAIPNDVIWTETTE